MPADQLSPAGGGVLVWGRSPDQLQQNGSGQGGGGADLVEELLFDNSVENLIRHSLHILRARFGFAEKTVNTDCRFVPSADFPIDGIPRIRWIR